MSRQLTSREEALMNALEAVGPRISGLKLQHAQEMKEVESNYESLQWSLKSLEQEVSHLGEELGLDKGASVHSVSDAVHDLLKPKEQE